jgi:hypothetical protein
MSLADDKKSKRSRAMRVATIFTGVAAATVGMTQAANAQEVAHPVGKPAVGQVGGAVLPDVRRLFGSIQYYDSCAAHNTHPTWLHVATFFSSSQAIGGQYEASVCFGFKGSLSSPPGHGMVGECGGNNYGFLLGITQNDTSDKFWFRPGTTWNNAFDWKSLDNVFISRWAGNDTCKSWWRS